LLALLAFNLGVEIGQLGFVLLVLALFGSHRVLALRLPATSSTGRKPWQLSEILKPDDRACCPARVRAPRP